MVLTLSQDWVYLRTAFLTMVGSRSREVRSCKEFLLHETFGKGIVLNQFTHFFKLILCRLAIIRH